MAQFGDQGLILMDTHLPAVMNRHQPLRSYTMQIAGLVVAIIVSAVSADSDRTIRSGCDGFINKPIGADFEAQIE